MSHRPSVRPSAQDTEEDLLKFQEEFLASKSKSSVKLLKPESGRVPAKATVSEDTNPGHIPPHKDVVTLEDLQIFSEQAAAATPPRKKSRFRSDQRQRVTMDTGSVPEETGSVPMETSSVPMEMREEVKQKSAEDTEGHMDKADRHISKVLADIVERDFSSVPVYFPQTTAFGGFPKVLHRGQIEQESETTTGKKRSLFAQQFAKSSAEEFGVPPNLPSSYYENVKSKLDDMKTKSDLPVGSRPVVDSPVTPDRVSACPRGETHKIHDENLKLIDSMSEMEIRAQQKKLQETLDPGLLTFLKNRSRQSKQPASHVTPGNRKRSGDSLGENASSENTTDQQRPPQTGVNTIHHPSQPGGDTTDHTSDDTEMLTQEPSTEASSQSSATVPEPRADWLHMDKLEKEKVEWMKDLPEPAPADHKTGKPARFDLHGNLVAMDANLPTHLGLHHHGDEPERAGYTVGELFHLSRSAHIQQRSLALAVLAKIIRNARLGQYHGLVSTPLVAAMLEGGLVLILRWALDDQTDNTMAAAINALHALIVSSQDEDGLDVVFSWYRGHEMSSIRPDQSQQSDENTRETTVRDADQTEETSSDAELLKQDLIKGLVKMRILSRLRYILEVWRPDSAIVLQIIDLVTAISRHSMEMAYEVSKCPRLLDCLFKEFLPWQILETWSEKLSLSYGCPSYQVLKLIRVICTSSRNISANIVSQYPLLDNMMIYLTQALQISSTTHVGLQKLALESLRTWKILMAYGLGVKYYHEYYSLLISLMQRACQVTHSSDPETVRLSSTLVCLLESVIHTAAKSTILATKATDRPKEVRFEIDHETTPAIPEIDWGQACGLHQPILHCMQQQLKQFTETYFDQRYDLSLAACCLNCVASWLTRAHSMPNHNAIDLLNQMETLCEGYLLPAIKSQSFSAVLINIRRHSGLLFTETSQKQEVLHNLVDLGSLVGGDMGRHPVLNEASSLPFLLGFVRILQAIKLHKAVAQQIYPVLLNHEELIQYLRQVVSKGNRSPLVHTHFVQFENSLQGILVSLATLQADMVDLREASLYHHVALYLLTRVQEGSELDVHHLLSAAIFNSSLLRELESTADVEMASNLSSKLRLVQKVDMIGATQREVPSDELQLRDDIRNNIVSVRNTYMTALSGSKGVVQMSRGRSEESVSYPDTFVLGTSGQLIVPVDWQFLPLVEIYTMSNILSQPGIEQGLSSEVTSRVTNCLRFVYYMEVYRPDCLDGITHAIRISRLMCTFLAGSDLFLEPGVQMYLTGVMRLYCRPVILDRMDFSKPIPGLASFYDLFMLLLEQYGAVSFGDPVFGNYLLLPLQQRHGILLRSALWGEYAEVLPALTMQINQVLIPVDRFLEPEESNPELLKLYHRALFSGKVTERRTPLLYLIAVHHLNRFMYRRPTHPTDLVHSIIISAEKSMNKTLKHHLLHYKKSDVDRMELYDELPANRKDLLDRVLQSEQLKCCD